MEKTKLITPFIHRIILATAIIVLAAIYFIDVQDLKNPNDRLMIDPIFWIMLILYPVILFMEWRDFKKNQTEAEEVEDEDSYDFTKRIGLFMVAVIIYLVALYYVGFIISTVLFLPSLMWILGTESKVKPLIIAVVATALMFMLFDLLLGVPLPMGLLFEGVF